MARTATTTTTASKTGTKRKAVSAASKPQSRPALKDRTNVLAGYGNDGEEVTAFDDDGDDMMGAGKPAMKRAKTTIAPAGKKMEAKKRSQQAKQPNAPALDLRTIPETQPDPNDDMEEEVEQSIEVDPMDVAQVPTPPPAAPRFVQRPASVQPRQNSRAPSVVPAGYPMQRERSGSAAAAERRGGDPELRRKLNDTTKKFEDLEMRYEALEAIGTTEAESNFAKLKKASDQKAKDAAELIAALKKEVAELRRASTGTNSETAGLQKQVGALTEAHAKTAAERDELRTKLSEAQNEVKSLEAKLLAARQQIAVGAQEAKVAAVPLSASEAQREARMKENLYSDLTGLIIRNVKRQEGEDVYDCIQTGRNGTLHFHLTIANDATTPHPKTPSGLSYEESEFAYEPLLDASRDRELLNLLPDYLTEEICFPRQHAQKFYTRILDSMSKRVEVVEDDEE